jgi:hypothetical protein
MQIDAKKFEIFLIIFIIYDYDVEKKPLKNHRSKKTHFHSI